MSVIIIIRCQQECMTFFSSDLLKEIGSFNEQPRPDQTMQDLSSMKSGNGSLPAPKSVYPTITPQPINPPCFTTMPPAPICKPIGTTPGIVLANPATLPPSNYDGGGWYVNFNDVTLQEWVPFPTRGAECEMMAPYEFMDDTPFMYQNGMVNTEMLSLWSEVSATFRYVTSFRQHRQYPELQSRFSGAEWDTYIANISQTLPIK